MVSWKVGDCGSGRTGEVLPQGAWFSCCWKQRKWRTEKEDLATRHLPDTYKSSFSAVSSCVPVNSASTNDFQFYTFGPDFSPGLHWLLVVIMTAERQPGTVGRAWSVISDSDHYHLLAVCPWRVTRLSKTQFPHLCKWGYCLGEQMWTFIYRMDKQQGPTVEHRELCSISHDKP